MARAAVHHGQVTFGHAAISKLLAERRQREVGLGYEQAARGVAVQAVNEPCSAK